MGLIKTKEMPKAVKRHKNWAKFTLFHCILFFVYLFFGLSSFSDPVLLFGAFWVFFKGPAADVAFHS